jgi:hypothetical protein
MAEQRKSVEALLNEAQETIDGIIRKKFRVTLNPDDGRYENQNAIELRQEVFTLLLEKLLAEEHQPEAERIRSVRDYAAVLTYHRCAQLRRTQNKGWHSLKNKVRYFIGKRDGYALWEDQNGELFCGFVSQRNRQVSRELSARQEKFYEAPGQALPPHLLSKDLRNLRDTDWEVLLDGLFNYLESPVELDELVTLIADAFGIQDEVQRAEKRAGEDGAEPLPLDPADPKLTPEEEAIQRQYLEKLWQEIGKLGRNERIVYLLNFRDADGDIELFVWRGIAGIEQIADALCLSDEHFARAWQALPLDEATRKAAQTMTDYYTKFSVLYVYIPLEDLLIAKLLGGERQQVINLRKGARRRLAKYLEPLR